MRPFSFFTSLLAGGLSVVLGVIWFVASPAAGDGGIAMDPVVLERAAAEFRVGARAMIIGGLWAVMAPFLSGLRRGADVIAMGAALCILVLQAPPWVLPRLIEALLVLAIVSAIGAYRRQSGQKAGGAGSGVELSESERDPRSR